MAKSQIQDLDYEIRDAELTILNAKQSALFECVQRIYDLSKDISTNAQAKEIFLRESSNIDNLRNEFQTALDKTNKRLLIVQPTGSPNYKPLVAFEQLYSSIRHLRRACLPANENSNQRCQDISVAPRKSTPSLPPIELIPFDGDIRSWPLFYASFKSNIHDNPSLTDSEKLYYLLGKIIGKARSTLSGITPTAENYQLLFQTLIDKYEDKRTLASSHMSQIFDFKPVTCSTADSCDLFIDRFVNAVKALQNLKVDNLTDMIFLHVALKKLDLDTVRAFEMNCGSSSIPTFESLVLFIKNQSNILRRTETGIIGTPSSNTRKPTADSARAARNSSKSAPAPPPQYNTYSYVNTVESTATAKCLCKNIIHQHLFKCPDFNKMSPEDRFKSVKETNSCVNCLSIKHRVSQCKSKLICRVCQLRHHTLLHFNRESNPTSSAAHFQTASTAPSGNTLPRAAVSTTAATCDSAPTERTDVSLCATSTAVSRTPMSHTLVDKPHCNTPSTVLLATAQVVVYDNKGNSHVLRALLDSASQSHFITKECCDRLGLKCQDVTSTIVKGFGGSEKIVRGSTEFEFSSRFNSQIKYNIPSLVVDNITESLPTALIDTSALSYLNKIPLADSAFATPNKIDILVGASLFPHLLLRDVVHTDDPSTPPAIETVLGYIIMGSVPTLCNRAAPLTACCTIGLSPEPIDTLIKRFWELEELTVPPAQCKDDIECEEFYRATTERDPASGRYTVGLPFRDDMYLLGNSHNIARKRFMCLEKKLEASPKMRAAYDEVIRDNLAQDYLSPAPPSDDPDDSSLDYVIPHHGVLREDKLTTKLRVVIDASAKTDSGQSLNDLLHSGPNLQGDLFKIILNFRLHAVALTADCRQMFMQIVVRSSDRRFQKILYRFDPQEPLLLYQFNRVCFGIKSSPYHALRTVKQLVADDGAKYPRAAEVVSTSLYMDDIAFSVETLTEAKAASKELIDLFKGAQWDLVKWNSNSKAALEDLPPSHKLISEVEFDKSIQHKILGLYWSTNDDYFYFKISPTEEKCSKRVILSTIARLWDIMGFVAPCVLYAKLLIKELWRLNLQWDDAPPPHIITMWRQFCSQLPKLNELKIPRHLGVTSDCVVTLLGFSDASEQAYGAVVYLHVSSASGVSTQLVCAKSKVAPMKPQSIARLELCGIVLLAKLLRTVYDTYRSRFPVEVYAFSDSRVALYWIQSSPHRWQTFVANRVVQVTDNIPADKFHHVAGAENPADCLSRGITPEKLASHPLWLHGPPWVSLLPSQWPINDIDTPPPVVPEQKILAHPVVTPEPDSVIYELAQRMSSWTKLLRVIVYIYRFAKLLPRRASATISSDDLEFAENKLLQILQQKYFKDEMFNLKNNRLCSKALNKLSPFINDGLLRVGGRLRNSELTYSHKHPAILPRHDHIVEMLIDYYHRKYLHAGPELLLSLLRQKYWILSARRIVRQRVHMCNTCFRMKPQPTYPLMADLQDCRVKQTAKAFTLTGCDYAGPIAYVPEKRRGVKSQKAYICVFTCLTTRAVHIEIATDLSTPSFLAALKRFLARRGPVEILHSDNGTNFVGANSYLRDLYKFLNNEYKPRFEEHLLENRIKWKFNCPTASHFGGCWESMVKVIKSHLFRVIGQQLLSYEELNTVLIQIECLLNSRPLTVLSPDPSEPTALTPSHFLHTVLLRSLPAPEVESSNLNLLHRHALIDKLVQSFWRRWRVEYLHGLQVRQKWNTPSAPIKPGTVVIIITENAPPLAWPLAIVHHIYPSRDGIVRVVSVKTAKGVYTRPVTRLCPLPNQ